MNNAIDTGGMAFPAHPKERLDTATGMTLRDHFAGLAMQGQAAKRGLERLPLSLVASCSYQMADAMIEARKNQS